MTSLPRTPVGPPRAFMREPTVQEPPAAPRFGPTPPVPGPPDHLPARRRPGWVVVGLTWATFGIYAIIWAGVNWREIKRERRDPTMYPFWHAVALFVPIYGLFRFHANFRSINELLAATRSDERVRPLAALTTFVAGNLLAAFPASSQQIIALNLVVGMSMVSWTIYHGQSGMNAYWDTRRNRPLDRDATLLERLLIGFGAGLWFLLLYGLLFIPV
jgi:hypothetical protein